MSEAPENRPEEDPVDEEVVEEETDAAAAEAARIGGEIPEPADDDPAALPGAEAGEGESEGFELAEKDLEETASHGGPHGFPDEDVPPPQEPEETAYGEPDQEIPGDGPEEESEEEEP